MMILTQMMMKQSMITKKDVPAIPMSIAILTMGYILVIIKLSLKNKSEMKAQHIMIPSRLTDLILMNAITVLNVNLKQSLQVVAMNLQRFV